MEFLKGFFRENAQESSSRLIFVCAFFFAAMLISFVTFMFYKTGKDFTLQCASLVTPIFAFATLNKNIQKGKEPPQPKE